MGKKIIRFLILPSRTTMPNFVSQLSKPWRKISKQKCCVSHWNQLKPRNVIRSTYVKPLLLLYHTRVRTWYTINTYHVLRTTALRALLVVSPRSSTSCAEKKCFWETVHGRGLYPPEQSIILCSQNSHSIKRHDAVQVKVQVFLSLLQGSAVCTLILSAAGENKKIVLHMQYEYNIWHLHDSRGDGTCFGETFLFKLNRTSFVTVYHVDFGEKAASLGAWSGLRGRLGSFWFLRAAVHSCRFLSADPHALSDFYFFSPRVQHKCLITWYDTCNF